MSLAFSTAATTAARPRGSAATNCPGTTRRTPDFPKVSWWTLTKARRLGSYSRITRRPESDPTRMTSRLDPGRRNGAIERMLPKASAEARVRSLPVVGSGRRISREVEERTTTISCCFGAENEP